MTAEETNIPQILQQAKTELAYTEQQFNLWQGFNVILNELIHAREGKKSVQLKRMASPVEFICLP